MLVSCTPLIQSWSGSCSSSIRLPKPPGTTTMSGLGDLVERGVGDHREGVRLVPDRARVLGDEDRLVARHRVEDVVRSGDVEGGEAVVEQVGDLHGSSSLGRWFRPLVSVLRRKRAGTRPGRTRPGGRRRGASSPACRSRTGPRRARPGSEALLEQLAGALDSKHLDVGRGCHPGLAPEEAGEVARAHRRPARRATRLAGRHRGCPRSTTGARGAACARRAASAEVGAELGLAAGPLEEEDQPASDLHRDLAPQVLLDQRQGEVHARGDARRCPDVPVADEDRLGIDLELRVAARELGGRRPVSGDGLALEQTGRASRNEPEQTEVTRRERRAALRIQRISSASFSASATPKPPATTSVSIGPRQRAVVVFGSEPVAARRGS